MHAYVVNLERSPDRLAHISAQLAKTEIQYEIVPAVDGRDLDLGDTKLVDPALVRRSGIRLGAAGCALSHLEVYRRVLADGRDTALVLEDDVNLPADLAILADAIAAEMTATEVVMLNFHSIEPCRITNAGSVRLPSSRLLVPRYRAYVHASYSESSSLAIIEAMAAGLPIVAGRVGPIGQLCEDGVEARFWSLDDPAEAAKTLIGLLDSEQDRVRAARASIERFHRDFDADVIAPRLHSFLLGTPSA